MKAFTLIEMMVVIAIISLLLGLTLPPVVEMWNQRHFAAGVTQLQGMLQVARSRAKSEMGPYGVWVFIDPLTQKQHALHIKWHGKPPEEVQHGEYAPAYQARYASIFESVPNSFYTFGGGIRVCRLGGEFSGTEMFNNFVIIFNRAGMRESISVLLKYAIKDDDTNDDGLGDVSLQPVIDLDDYWEINGRQHDLKPGLPITGLVNVVPNDATGRYSEFDNEWGVVIYDHNNYDDLTGYPAEQSGYLAREGTPILLNPFGDIIRGTKGQD